jgi:hypothetical protein
VQLASYLVPVVVSLVAGGYLGYKFGRYVEAKAQAALAVAGKAAAAVRAAVK